MGLKSLVLLICFITISAGSLAQPKLVVQITVDQLRADMLSRYQQHFIRAPEQPGLICFLNRAAAISTPITGITPR